MVRQTRLHRTRVTAPVSRGRDGVSTAHELPKEGRETRFLPPEPFPAAVWLAGRFELNGERSMKGLHCRTIRLIAGNRDRRAGFRRHVPRGGVAANSECAVSCTDPDRAKSRPSVALPRSQPPGTSPARRRAPVFFCVVAGYCRLMPIAAVGRPLAGLTRTPLFCNVFRGHRL